MIELERMREHLAYDPETGRFTWVKPTSTRNRVGARAGNRSGRFGRDGYRQIEIFGQRYYAHRLAWLYMTGREPVGVIDHIDGDRDNNAFANLRDVSVLLNMQNMKRPATTNKSGYLGVCKPRGRKDGKFVAHIKVDGKTKFLGSFEDPESAHNAYVAAKRLLHQGCTL